MYIQMKNKNYRVSRATLYNTIVLLLDCKLIRKHQFGKNQLHNMKKVFIVDNMIMLYVHLVRGC